MNTDLSNYRKSYEKHELSLKDTPEFPMEFFQKWFQEVDHFFPDHETNAMSLATIGLDGFPKSRVVLLKSYSEDGFVFFTNYNSEKGKSIIQNPHVCLSFFWPDAERQIIIKGLAKKVSNQISDDYFQSRPRGSQLGAIASNQSHPIADRGELENRLKELTAKYDGKPIPRPEHWGGFIIKPVEIEFWQGRANRLHDRIRYALTNEDSWTKTRLSP